MFDLRFYHLADGCLCHVLNDIGSVFADATLNNNHVLGKGGQLASMMSLRSVELQALVRGNTSEEGLGGHIDLVACVIGHHVHPPLQASQPGLLPT